MEGQSIASMEVIPSAAGLWVAALTTLPSQLYPIHGAPFLDFVLQCNCFYVCSSILLNFSGGPSCSSSRPGPVSLSSNHSDRGDDTDESDMECEEDDIHSIVICCAGSSCDHFQPLLQIVRKFCNKMGELTVVLEPESDNVRDKNAILIKVEVDGALQSIGYIPVHDLHRVHNAYFNKTLLSKKILLNTDLNRESLCSQPMFAFRKLGNGHRKILPFLTTKHCSTHSDLANLLNLYTSNCFIRDAF